MEMEFFFCWAFVELSVCYLFFFLVFYYLSDSTITNNYTFNGLHAFFFCCVVLCCVVFCFVLFCFCFYFFICCFVLFVVCFVLFVLFCALLVFIIDLRSLVLSFFFFFFALLCCCCGCFSFYSCNYVLFFIFFIFLFFYFFIFFFNFYLWFIEFTLFFAINTEENEIKIEQLDKCNNNKTNSMCN